MTHKIQLAPVAASPQVNGSRLASVRLGDLGNGILSLQVSGPDGRNALSRDLLDPLLRALEEAREARSAKVLILRGTPAAFLSGGRRECNLAVSEKLFQTLASFPYPVIAAMQGDAAGAGFLAASLCDFMVCSQTARYSFTDPESGLFPGAEEDRLFRSRFGEARAADFLYWSHAATGRQLREKGWSCPVLPGEEVDAHAQALASSLCRKPGESLRILKQHLARPFVGLAGDLIVMEPVTAEPVTAEPVAAESVVEMPAVAEPPGSGPSEPPAIDSGTPAPGLEVDASREDVLVVRLRPSQADGGWLALSGPLSDLLARVGRSRRHKAVVMAGGHEDFLPTPEAETAGPAGMEFLRLILAAPVPVVAALESDARGFAWLAAQFFDACVYQEQGTYSLGRLTDVPEAARQAVAAFAFRFGGNSAREMLFTGREYSGLELRHRFQAAAAREQVLPQAIRLAGTWAGLPFGTVAAWKAGAARLLREKIDRQPPPETSNQETCTIPETNLVPEPQPLPAAQATEPDPQGSAALPLQSRVVSAALHPEGILIVRMEDREAKNMFSEALMEGLQEAFAQVEGIAAKVVILTGFDRYFASGGTKETLLAIQQGQIKFTDNKTFQIGMDCRVPVIAAMQGHGIGAGWAMGMFADFTLHCEEGRYLSPYMNYGFTPGAGATFIFPEKAGHDLARETLLTAREYAGDELRSRAMALPVLPGDQVLAAAIELAGHMAGLQRRTLAALKRQFNHALRKPLEETYALELAMHGKTFVGKTETLQQIHGNFVSENGLAPAPTASQSAAPPRMPHPSAGSVAPASLAASLKKLLAHELQLREEEIDENTQFVDLGLDSITGVTWVRKINEKFGTSIEATKIYSYPTLAKLLQYVQEEAGKLGAPIPAPEAPAPQAPAPAIPAAKAVQAVHAVQTLHAKQARHASPATRNKLPLNGIVREAGRLASWRNQTAPRVPAAAGSLSPTVSAQYRPQPIAIIGMAGQFPQARNLEEFWENLAQGRDCITEVPGHRWDADAYYSPGGPAAGKTNCKWMGALEDYDRFDPLFFNISPVEAESMDPQQRLFLQTCWQSIESAGYNPKSLSGSRCGVFVGCSGSEYLQSSREHQLTAQGFTGGATSILAARISFFLNLQGPCLSIDTACSSSLVAIAGACDSLCAGGSDAALAGGVFIMAGPALHVMASQAGMLSPDGRCHSFDQRANGFVPGEAVGVVMLKRLSDAERDRDDILGVIQGWGVNQDGKTNGITAPNPESQARLEMEVYDRHGIDPAGIQLIEAHGTGTKLGDPIEVEALRKTFRKYTRKTGYCALGSVKSNIGHCLTAAGVSGVIKVLLAMKHRQLPPTIHFDRLNEHVALAGSPFFVNDRLQEWVPSEGRRQAAVSSFGFSGTNAHLVIAEHLPPRHAEEPITVLAENGRYAVPLSARTSEQLGDVARALLEALKGMRREEETPDVAELAYTLQVGRDALGERLGFMVDSVGQLAEKLEAYLKGDSEGSGAFRGQVLENKEGMRLLAAGDIQSAIVESFLAQRKITQLLELWVKGLALDWNRLYGETKPRRIRLPAYPFARDRYWLEAGKAPGIASAIHPLLHRNTSNLGGQSYRSRFSGSEAFVAAGAEGRKFLAPMVWLEMARAAVENAVPAEAATPVLELRDLAWEAPMAVGEGREAVVTLSLDDQGRIAFEIRSRETLHFHGEAVFLDAPAFSTLDIPRLRESGQSAVLDLPATADLSEYVLPPAWLESLLQGCLARVAGSGGSRNPRLRIAALAALTVSAARPPRSLAWVRPSPEAASENPPVLDVDLCDPEGNVWACLRGFALAEAGVSDGLPEAAAGESQSAWTAWKAWDRASFASRWEEQAGQKGREEQPGPAGKPASGHASVLIACWGPSFQLDATLLEHYERAGKAAIRILWFADRTEKVSDRDWWCDTRDPGALAKCLEGMETPDALYFLALDESPMDHRPAEELLDSRESAETHMLRLVKHLKRSFSIGDGGGGIDTYLLTLDAHAEALKGGAPRFRGAGTAGLGYSLAQGSHRFKVRNLDLSAGDLETPEDRKALLAAILREPPSDRGEITRLREGRRYRRAFFRLKWETPAQQGIRQQGVYLIVGGSGTVGRIITRNLISKYQARVVWTGRSGEDSDKVRKAIRQIGERVSYVQADATSLADMRRAVEVAKREHGRIDGALFAGMVFDFGNSIDQTTEEEFRSILEVKTRGSLAVYAALEKEPLDFLCYFSSGQAYAFSGAAQLSAYAAGITGADAFANALRRVAAFPVGTLNWGFWKASVEEIKALPDGVSTENLDALEDAEGFECFERFVNELRLGRLHQVLCMKASPQIEALMDCNRTELIALPGGSPRGKQPPEGGIEVPSQKLAELKQAGKQASLEEWFIGLLYGQVTGLLGAEALAAPRTAEGLQELGRIIGKYSGWWKECLGLLAGRGWVHLQDGRYTDWKALDAGALRDSWRIQKEIFRKDPDCAALADLVDDCLENLPDILQGRRLATDVIFPDSSMAKVEGVYKHNTLCDTFNEIVANAVVACARGIAGSARPQAGEGLRILEIGAGTGGTSAIVFPKLRPFQDSVAKYTYTDLSKAFLFHAEKVFAPECPYLECRLLDIEQPIEPQGFELGGYDVVLATNVLHATRNIRRTLRNAKAALRQGGMLVLNEMSRKSISTHLTFGLLDGWWLSEDPHLRLPGCPGLAPESWQRILEEEGFQAVTFPAREGHELGNQIIVAHSDGIIRQSAAGPRQERSASAPAVADPTLVAPVAPIAPVAPKASAAPTTSAVPVALAHDLPGFVRSNILACLAGVLKIPPELIRPDAAFSDYGVDSILGVSFIKQLNERFSISLNTAIIFDHSSLDGLSRHVASAYREQVETKLRAMAPSPGAARQTAPVGPAAVKPIPLRGGRSASVRGSLARSGQPAPGIPEIAVIGMSGMFPKADGITAFWNNLLQGVSGIEELPERYLDGAFYSPEKSPGKTRCKWGGILGDRDCFDPLFFNISPKEAESMNPHQRLVMQESWKALEDAGYNPRTLAGSQAGIFIGAEPTGYVGETFTGFSDAIVASRLSYFLNLNGPAFVVNTGCSSSAVALHLACESLRHGETALALAGGVNACMNRHTQVRLDEIEMLSPSGRCLPFDGRADGTVISEGVGMVVLKRLEDAVAAGDPIYGVICGSGINQDGASNGITAPNGAAQEQLIAGVYRKFKLDPALITYVEAHGTGTKLGDPVEANALVRAFRSFTPKQGYCALGTAKAHIGHTAAAAGVVGLIKVLLSMRHKRIPHLPGFADLNPLIELQGSPFRINAGVEEWKTQGAAPRMAAINSFGHSGTNAHLVVREYLAPEAVAHPPASGNGGQAIVPLSAKTREQLREKARDLLVYLRQPQARSPEAATADMDLMDVAFTLQTGREAMEERLGILAGSLDQLAGKLRAWLDGEPGLEDVFQGTARRKHDSVGDFSRDEELQEAVGKWIARGKLAKLAELWVKGLELDWEGLHREAKPRRVRLPAYPFAKERYWTNNTQVTGMRGVPPGAAPAKADFGTIEDILKNLDEDSIDTGHALRLLKTLV